MGVDMGVLIDQMIQFATIVVLGFIIYKLKITNDNMVDNASSLSIKYCFPLLLFTTIVSGATRAQMLTMLPFAIGVIICEVFAFAATAFTGKLLRLKGATYYMHIGCGAYGNTGFVGLPVAIALFPETGAIAVAIYMFIDFIFMYSLTPILCDAHNGVGKKGFSMRKAVNTITLAAVAGFICVLIGLRPINNPVWTAVEGIGSASKYIMLTYLGADIARKGFGSILKNKKVFITEAFKVAVIPLLAFMLMGILGLFTYEQSMIVLTMMLSPTMTAIAFMSRESGSDENYAVASIVIGHIACVFTVPLCVWIANLMI